MQRVARTSSVYKAIPTPSHTKIRVSRGAHWGLRQTGRMTLRFFDITNQRALTRTSTVYELKTLKALSLPVPSPQLIIVYRKKSIASQSTSRNRKIIGFKVRADSHDGPIIITLTGVHGRAWVYQHIMIQRIKARARKPPHASVQLTVFFIGGRISNGGVVYRLQNSILKRKFVTPRARRMNTPFIHERTRHAGYACRMNTGSIPALARADLSIQ